MSREQQSRLKREARETVRRLTETQHLDANSIVALMFPPATQRWRAMNRSYVYKTYPVEEAPERRLRQQHADEELAAQRERERPGEFERIRRHARQLELELQLLRQE